MINSDKAKTYKTYIKTYIVKTLLHFTQNAVKNILLLTKKVSKRLQKIVEILEILNRIDCILLHFTALMQCWQSAPVLHFTA